MKPRSRFVPPVPAPVSGCSRLVPTLKLTLALALASILALPSPAQESQPTAASRKTRETRATRVLENAGLVVKTRDSEVAMAMLDRFRSRDLLPDLEKGEHYVLKLFGPGKLKISTGDGDVGFLEAVMTPGPLISVFEEDFAQELSAVEANITFTLGQFGVPTKEIQRMIRGVASFPEQVARIDLRVEGNPGKTAKGVKADLCVTPAAGSWLGRIVEGLEPSETGAPVLDAGAAPMRLSAAVKPAGLVALAEPMLGLMACLGTRNRAERETGRQMLRKLLDAYDGSLAAAGDPFQSSVRLITGLRNAAGVKEVMASEGFSKLTENQASIVPSVDAEFEPRAFIHREVTVSRLTVDMTASGLEQVTTRYSAVAGGYLLSTSGEGEDASKAMIDAVLDQRVKRAPLARNALLTLTLDLEKMFDHLAGLGIPAPMEEGGPKLAEIRLLRDEGSLRLKISIE